MVTGINLQKTFGGRYRIGFDPAYDPRGKARENPDTWMFTIPCRYGTIYPTGGDRLRVDVDYHNQVAHRVAALPACQLAMDGDFEKTIEFPVTMFDEVARIVKPQRRYRSRTVTERDHLAKVGAGTRFPVQVNAGKKSISGAQDAFGEAKPAHRSPPSKKASFGSGSRKRATVSSTGG